MLCLFMRSSAIGSHEMCEMKYFFEYNLGYKNKTNKAAVKGTITHRALQALGDKNLAVQASKKTIDFEGKRVHIDKCDDIEYITKLAFDYYTKHETSVSLSHYDLRDCIKWVYKTIEYNNGQLDPRKQNVHATEKFFDFEIREDWARFHHKLDGKIVNGYLGIKGTIDLITKEGENNYGVLDYKSGARKNWATDEIKTYEYFEHDFQLLLYYYALKNLDPSANFEVGIHYINDGGLFSFAFDDVHYKRAENLIRQKFEYIKNVELPRQLSSTNSNWKCQKLCAFSAPQEGTGLTQCQFMHKEIRENGMINTVNKYADFSKVGTYGDGGGRLADK